MRKRLAVFVLTALILALSLFPTPARADASFLIGDWESSDGSATLSFYEDGTYEVNLGFLPESGSWFVGESNGDAYPIQMTGSAILSLMQLAYGFANNNYHFEILECDSNNFYLVQVYGDYTAWDSPCKLPFTRVGAAPNLELPPEGSSPSGNSGSAGSSATLGQTLASTATQEMHIPFDSDTTVTLDWGWDLFRKDASEYDQTLAIAAAILSQAAESASPEVVEERLEQFGYENTATEYYDVTNQANKPSCAFASRAVSFDGETKYMVALVVRGTTDFGDMATDIDSLFNDFDPPAKNVLDRFNEYYEDLDDYYGADVSADNTIMFVAGHSLGGAVAGQLGQALEDISAQRNAMFVYTIASPKYNTSDNRGDYKNIHNIINIRDAVPKWKPSNNRYGNDWYYNSAEDKFDSYFDKVYETRDWHAGNPIDEHILSTYLAMMLCDVPSNIGSGAVNPFSLSSFHCPVDIEVYDGQGELLATTSGEDVAITKESLFWIFTDGEEKYVMAPPDTTYSVRAIGTGDGEMTVTQQDLDAYSGDVIEGKSFENVPVSTGATYELAIDGQAPAGDAQLKDADGTAIAGGAIAEEGAFPWWIVIVCILGAVLLVIIVFLIFSRKGGKGRRKKGKKGRGGRRGNKGKKKRGKQQKKLHPWEEGYVRDDEDIF